MITTPDIARRIRVGVAGWAYDDWNDCVYPRDTRDKLRFVAGYVDVIEINSSFYRPPTPRATASWVARTADLPDFRFTAKLHQDITHGGRLEPAMVAGLRAAFGPMAQTGRLTHLLAQFRYDFADTPRAREHLARIRDAFADMAGLAVEVRHRSWQADEALAFLAGLGVAVCNLDYPTAHNSFDLPVCTVGRDAYFRLHGRNARAWFDSGAGRDETYNYCYGREELDGIAHRAAQVAGASRSLTLVANNHFRGQEMVNALELMAMLNKGRLRLPGGLAELYPRLKSVGTPDSPADNPEPEAPRWRAGELFG